MNEPPADPGSGDRLLFEANPNPMFVFAEDSLRLLEVNQAMVAKYGWSRAELLGMTLADLRPPEEMPRLLAALGHQRGMQAGSAGEWRHRRKDGSCFDAEVTLSCLQYHGVPARLVMVADITDRKHVETELRHSRELLEEAEHLSHTGAWEWDLTTNRWSFSDEWLAIHGCEQRSLTPEELLALAHPHDRTAIARAFRLARAGRAPFDMEHRIVRRNDGAIRVVHGCGRFVRNAAGEVCKLYGFAHDITERKQTERHMEFLDRLHPLMMQVRDPEELIRRALQQAAIHLGLDRASWSVVSPDRAMVHSDDVFPDDRPVVSGTYRIADFGAAELIGMVEKERGLVIHDVAADPFTAPRAEAYLAANVAAFAAEVLVTDEGPKAVITAVSTRPRVWRPDEVHLLRELAARLFPAVERARAEAAMRASEEKYRSLFESIDAGFCLIEVIFDDEGKPVDYRFLEVNPAFERQTGIADAVGRTMRGIAPGHEEYWYEIYGLVARTGVPRRFEHRAEHLGRWFYVFAYRTGRPEDRRVAVLFNDISERKQAEADLRESEERLRVVFDSVHDAIVVHLPDGRVIDANDVFLDMYGVRRENLGEVTIQAISSPRSPLETAADIWAKVIAGEPQFFEWKARRIDNGAEFDVEVFLRNVRYGGRDAIVGSVRDVTARKLAEAALRASEERFRELADAMPQLVWTARADGTVDYYNHRVREFDGFHRGEDGLWIWTPVLHPDDVAATQAAWTRAVETGAIYQAEHRVRRRDGTYHWYLSRGIPSRDAAGNIVKWYGTSTDIDDAKTGEEALRESERRFRGTFENAAVGIAHVSPDGRWLRVNDRLCEIVGYSRGELLSRNFADITHPDDLQLDWDYARRALDGEIDTYAIDKRYIRKDGTVVWISLTVSLARKPDGGPDYFISVMRDISVRKEAEAKIRQLNEELESRVEQRTAELAAANRELEAFSYSVSHDLRAPLRAMDGFSKILLEDYSPLLDETGRDYLQRVRSAAQRMGQLIDVMLELSRLNRCEMICRTVDLSALAWSIAAELKASEPERAVEWHIQPGMAAVGDPRLLRVLLENLLGNAWKYTGRTEPARIGFGFENGEWHVRDNGVGFDMGHAARLFTPFQRLHSADEFEGLGIGLATVRRIVARHGGTIRAEAAPGVGAVFYFTLAPAPPPLS